MKKITKILFSASLLSLIITILLQFSQRYNQILFVVRHSALYLAIAFLISTVISIFYYRYKTIFIKRKIKLVFLNVITLSVLCVSLLWIAETRLDYIAENEVPSYMNEILYDEYNNKIYESILDGVKPSVDLIEKTSNRLHLHIEESCVCQQRSYDIENFYPEEDFDYFIDSIVEISVDIEILYNEDNSIDSYTILETRRIKYEPENVFVYYGYVSRKLEITNEYNNDSILAHHKDYYYSDYMIESEYNLFNSNDHYSFNEDEAVYSLYRLYKSFNDLNEEVYIMEHQVQEKGIDEIAVLDRKDSDLGTVVIHFEESENRLNNDSLILWHYGPVKNDLKGSISIKDNQLEYYQEYDQTSVEGGRVGYTELSRIYNDVANRQVLRNNTITVDSIEYPQKGLSYYKDLFSTTSYVEMVGRDGTVIEDITELENPFEVSNVKLYEIKEEDYGYSVTYYLDASPLEVDNTHKNSHVMLIVELPENITREDLIQSTYFNYASLLFQSSYAPSIVYENNEFINFIADK